MLLLLAAAALLAFFKAFGDRGELVLALPLAFAVAFTYTAGDYLAEWSLARATGATARFRLWLPGAASLVISSVFFRSAFGYPGYLSELDASRTARAADLRRLAGLRAGAFLAAGVALALPFLLAGALWRWDVAEHGVGVALMMGAAAAMPFSPMPGRDLWQWRRVAWLAAFAALAAMYVLWQLAMLPVAVVAGAGALGGALYVAALLRLRKP